jgi:hypothetical protein
MGWFDRIKRIRSREAGKDGPVDQNGDFYNPNGDIPNPDATPNPSRMDRIKTGFRDFGRAASNRAHDALGGLAKVWNKGKDLGYRGVEKFFETKPGDKILRRVQRKREARNSHTRDLARDLMTRPEGEDEIAAWDPHKYSSE